MLTIQTRGRAGGAQGRVPVPGDGRLLVHDGDRHPRRRGLLPALEKKKTTSPTVTGDRHAAFAIMV